MVPEISEEPAPAVPLPEGPEPEPEPLEELLPKVVVELGVGDVCFVSGLDEGKVVAEVNVLSGDKPAVPKGLTKDEDPPDKVDVGYRGWGGALYLLALDRLLGSVGGGSLLRLPRTLRLKVDLEDKSPLGGQIQ